MAPKTTPWDPSEYLDSPESIAAYLEAAFEDGDLSLIAAALGDTAPTPAIHGSPPSLAS